LNGYQSVINVWRDALEAKNVEIETETKVSKIQWQNSDGKVVVKTEDGDTFEADHAIVTVSLGLNFINILRAASTRVDLKSAKILTA